jgi:hypothetical protein
MTLPLNAAKRIKAFCRRLEKIDSGLDPRAQSRLTVADARTAGMLIEGLAAALARPQRASEPKQHGRQPKPRKRTRGAKK